MAWVTPPTFVSGAVLTAAQLNILTGDLNETAAAKATTSGQFFASTGANTLAARLPTVAYVATLDTTTGTSYADMGSVGPTATVTTGAKTLVCMYSRLVHNTAAGISNASFAISGATTAGSSDIYTLAAESGTANEDFFGSAVHLYDGLNSGSNTFKMQYKVSGAAGTGSFSDRRLSLIPF